MEFIFSKVSILLLPFALAGGVAALWLTARFLRQRQPPDLLLACLLGLPTLRLTERILAAAGWSVTHPLVMAYVPWYVGLAIGPACYVYFRSLTNQEFRWRAQLRHLAPGLLQLGLLGAVAAYDWGWRQRQADLAVAGQPGPAQAVLAVLDFPLTLLGYGLLLGYSLRTLADYRRYRQYLGDNFSDSERLRFEGLRTLLLLQVLGLALGVGFTALDATPGFNHALGWYAFALRGALIYGLIAVGIQANYAASTSPLRFLAAGEKALDAARLAEAALANVAAPTATAARIAGETAERHLPSAAVEEQPASGEELASLPAKLQPWHEQLLHLMATDKPWLEPELNLAELARRLGLHAVLLSKVINTGSGQSFSDFVNTYRVEEAHRKLLDPRFAHYSLVGVALESGFNSKSTFNRVFKKLRGYAPSQLKRPEL